MTRVRIVLGLVSLIGMAGCAAPRPAAPPPPPPREAPPPPAPRALASTAVVRAALADLVRDCGARRCAVAFDPETTVDSVAFGADARHLEVYFNDALAHAPYRPATVNALKDLVRERLLPLAPGYALHLWAGKHRVEALVPNAFRDAVNLDRARLARDAGRPVPLVRNLDRPWQPTAGLAGRYVALWPSHGWYYEAKRDRWEWQRDRLFQTVEDLLPYAFTQPYLVPALERAGATVLVARERDIQPHEVIVDNDRPASGYTETRGWRTGRGPGYARGTPPYTEGVNPFRLGTHRVTEARTAATDSVRWVPTIPQPGEYAVRVSYTAHPDAVTDAAYTVHHAGGTTRFLVNQQIGGGSWVYLGTFRFAAGRRPPSGSVVLTNASGTPGRPVSADAVRFGGGMGIVARGGATSGRVRWQEAARYTMQTDGMPDALVYSLSGGTNDYTDDYRGRGEWVNYLRGTPAGPNAERASPGLGLPIDLSLALHTDAGVHADTTVGTLLIYSTEGSEADADYPGGGSRLASRDLSDLLQTQIVGDLRQRYDPTWRRRSMWDRAYSEVVRPNVPSALVELLAHENFLDMRFALDPRFRFDVGRAVYKGVLRFLATQYGTEYVVQPLPVSHFQALLDGTDGVALGWQPTPDPLEPTAEPDAYVVYARTEDGGWDNGRLVESTAVTLRGLEPGVLYSYRVAAVNAGGESAPSEALAVLRGGRGPVLVVNGFDRVAPPEVVETETRAGFTGVGVPDRYDLGYTGPQANFDRRDVGRGDGAGWGASRDDWETTVLPGNTFDFPRVHGASLRAAGVAFASTSAAALAAGSVDPTPYRAIDLILGGQKTTPSPRGFRPPAFEAFPAPLRDALTRYCERGGGLFVSGSYVGTDVFAGQPADAPGPRFARTTLGIRLQSGDAATTGAVVSPNAALLPDGFAFDFAAELNPEVYAATSPDAVAPADPRGATVLRYAENGRSAAVARRGACPAVVLGFPFETIRSQDDRDTVMRAALRFLGVEP